MMWWRRASVPAMFTRMKAHWYDTRVRNSQPACHRLVGSPADGGLACPKRTRNTNLLSNRELTGEIFCVKSLPPQFIVLNATWYKMTVPIKSFAISVITVENSCRATDP